MTDKYTKTYGVPTKRTNLLSEAVKEYEAGDWTGYSGLLPDEPGTTIRSGVLATPASYPTESWSDVADRLVKTEGSVSYKQSGTKDLVEALASRVDKLEARLKQQEEKFAKIIKEIVCANK